MTPVPSVPTAAPVVTLVDAERVFRSHREAIRAVDGVSLELRAGEVVGVVGPSGSGKTTLLHLVMGWELPDLGEVVRRSDLGDDWSGAAVVPQGLGLLPELTARQNIELGARLGGGDRSRATELLDEFGMADLADRLPSQLSNGEQQRVAVARAVVCGPTLLVADEPTAHQDVARADVVMSVLRRVAADGGAVLVATHDERVLDSVDRTLTMSDGRLADRPARTDDAVDAD